MLIDATGVVHRGGGARIGIEDAVIEVARLRAVASTTSASVSASGAGGDLQGRAGDARQRVTGALRQSGRLRRASECGEVLMAWASGSRAIRTKNPLLPKFSRLLPAWCRGSLSATSAAAGDFGLHAEGRTRLPACKTSGTTRSSTTEGRVMEGRKRKRKWMIVLSGLVLAGLIAAAVAVAAINRANPVTKFSGRDEIVEACTTTTTFQTIPQMTRTFTQGTGGGSVVVQFSGALSLSGGQFDTGFLRLTIDGAQQSPGVVPAIGANERGAHAFNWQAPLSAGFHTARIQWRTDLGGTLCADARSMIIFHR